MRTPSIVAPEDPLGGSRGPGSPLPSDLAALGALLPRVIASTVAVVVALAAYVERTAVRPGTKRCSP